ncbi:hypothetical protein WJ968_20060 [Achromobacter xylosoxidans]
MVESLTVKDRIPAAGESSGGQDRDSRLRQLFREQTMGDAQFLAAQEGSGRAAYGATPRGFNDIGFLKEAGRGPNGEIYWNTGATSYPVPDRGDIVAVPLPALSVKLAGRGRRL